MPGVDGENTHQPTRSPLQKAHCIIYDQSFSDCGKFLAVSDIHGFLSVFNLTTALSPNTKAEDMKAYFTTQISDHAIYSLLTWDGLLICGGNKRLEAWSWADLISKTPKLIWSLKVPAEGVGLAEVNSLAVNSEDTILYAGCGDSMVHCWDLSSGTYLYKLTGHSGVVQSVCHLNTQSANQCLSASEDGTVRIWDTRARNAEAQHCVCPSKQEALARPSLGGWLACVAAEEDLMVCGGGPKLSLWSLRTLTSLVAMDTPSYTQHTVMFADDTIISSGGGRSINHWYINGDLKSSVPVSPTTVYSVRINNNNCGKKVLSAAGSGYKIDVCLNFGYKSFTFEL